MLLKHQELNTLHKHCFQSDCCCVETTVSIGTCHAKGRCLGNKGEERIQTRDAQGQKDGGTRSWTYSRTWGPVVSTKTGGTDSCCLCCRSLPCSDGKGAACAGALRVHAVPSRAVAAVAAGARCGFILLGPGGLGLEPLLSVRAFRGSAGLLSLATMALSVEMTKKLGKGT